MHQHPRRDLFTRRKIAAGVGCLAAAACSSDRAARFPSRPLMILSPARPGGGTDQIARMIKHAFEQEALASAPIEVINRGGAGGAIGMTELITRHRGDPYMIMAVAGGLVSAAISQRSPFSLTDTVPLARLLIEHLIIAVPANSPFQDIAAFLAAFRERPESISWCGGSAGGTDHTLVGMAAEAAGVSADRLSYVAYAGGGAASAALLGGQVSAGVNGFSEWRSLADSGRVRILACASAKRFDPRIPTLREAGLDVVYQNWRGAFAPPGLDAEHLAWWIDRIERMRQSRTWTDMVEQYGLEDGYLPGDAFLAQIHEQKERTAQVLATLGIGGTSGGVSTMGPYAFAGIVGAAGALAIGATIAEQAQSRKSTPTPASTPGAADESEGPTWAGFAAGAGAMLVYIFALEWIGFLLATPLLILGLSWLMKVKSLVLNTLAGIGVTVAIWLLFTQLLYVRLP